MGQLSSAGSVGPALHHCLWGGMLGAAASPCQQPVQLQLGAGHGFSSTQQGSMLYQKRNLQPGSFVLRKNPARNLPGFVLNVGVWFCWGIFSYLTGFPLENSLVCVCHALVLRREFAAEARWE